ncbi:MAG: ferritin-like domain-containing protein [Bryobacter sp.]|nr:ferritin-like domain-containing protein [Bryobacter sp.]
MTKYLPWLAHFRTNTWKPADFFEQPLAALPPKELALLAASLPQFQLGEGSDGQGLLDRARQAGFAQLPEAMQLFIQEEQRHSTVLGLWMDAQGMARLRHHWVDGAFRRVRKLAGFELMAITLTCAECLAVPYYTAVAKVTSCAVLRQICRRMLADEAFHLEFQALNLSLCAEKRGEVGKFLTVLLQLGLLGGASALVYWLYRNLFRAAGFSPLQFLGMTMEAYRPIFRALGATTKEHSTPSYGWLR